MSNFVQIQVNNVTQLDWFRNNWHVGAGQEDGVNWTDEIKQAPLEVLPKGLHTTAMADQVFLTGLISDALWMILGYGIGNESFAVKLELNCHVITFGKGSTWQVWDNGWKNLGSDASTYEWHFSHCTVRAVPTLGNNDASALITILPK